jgi:Putative MetA-pathway of phenol degradation
MNVRSRNLRRFLWLISSVTLWTSVASSAPQSDGTPPDPTGSNSGGGREVWSRSSFLPMLGALPGDDGADLDDDLTPAQVLGSPTTPAASPAAPAPAASGAAPATPAARPSRSYAAFANRFSGGGRSSVSAPGGSVVLNSIGDQGVISFQPPGNKGPAVSVARNFALNITDNNSAPLQNRIIPLEYYHFFDSNRVYPGLTFAPNRFAAAITPSQSSRTRVVTQDDRYVFGFETIVAPRMSILFRQSVVTIEQPNVALQQGTKVHQLGGIRSGWGDLQISPKYLLHEDEKVTASAGLGMIVPLGENAPYHQFGNSAFVFQPYFLFLAKPTDRLVLQAGFEYDIPIANNLSYVSLFRYLLFAGYKVYDEPDSPYVRQIYPVLEIHGSDLVGGFTQDMVNVTAGLRVNAFKRSQFGLGYSTPLTQERQYGNEILFNYNIFF